MLGKVHKNDIKFAISMFIWKQNCVQKAAAALGANDFAVQTLKTKLKTIDGSIKN